MGAESVKTSDIKDHSCSDQHIQTMQLLKKEHAAVKGLATASYTPIAQLLQGLFVDENAKFRQTFNNYILLCCYRKKLAFTKYPSICQLEAQHGVDLDAYYLNKTAGLTFCHYIAESRRNELRTACLYLSYAWPKSVDSQNQNQIDYDLQYVQPYYDNSYFQLT